MIANHIPLVQFMDGVHQFVIPIFQRDYSWVTRHCKQLWDDVVRVGKDPQAKAHFLGSVVYIGAEDIAADVPRWLVIDGQQRLTTINLLFTALRDHLKKVGDSDGMPTTAAAVEDRFLQNRHAKADRHLKLALRRVDHETLAALTAGKDLPSSSSKRIRENYAYFLERLGDADLATVWRGIGKLVVVHVSLARGQDDPQLIFESLNSTGLDLTQADLIRNYVLMRLDEDEQTRLYLEYWQPIEGSFGARYASDFDKLARDWLTLHLKPSKQLKADAIYQHFRDFFVGACATRTVEDVLGELRRYGQYFVAYSHGSETRPKLAEVFGRLRHLVEVASPAVLRLYECFDRKKTLTEDDFVDAIELMESYVFRRSVCDMQTRSLGQIFASLAYRINDDQPLASLKMALARQGRTSRYPIDDEFRAALMTRDIYDMRHRKYLLDRLENDSKEKIDTSSFTIEHVLPQSENLHTDWRTMLGSDWKSIQNVWVHRLGNLTLTAYNSEYSDRPFDVKKKMTKGFNESPLRLNSFIKQQSVWTSAEIEKRGADLAAKALSIWKPLAVDRGLVRQAELVDMKARAAAYSADTLGMDPTVRALFEELRKEILGLGADVIELFGPKTVTYRVFDFFVEVIPRRGRLTILLNLDVEDCAPLPENAWDTDKYEFVTYATQDAGIGYSLRRAADVPEAMKLVRLAAPRLLTDGVALRPGSIAYAGTLGGCLALLLGRSSIIRVFLH
jgi:predicted transport protein